ncbi:hypothetical protein [Photobacterium kishitanii]|uniref:hypothetical protein n=1 Tax=Photobacterium kishitanii TaxID=318456 RepID=UPI002739C316|nr:hypothetical protein [Photobacterium kishitanii]
MKFAYAAQAVMDPNPINLASGVTNNINILLEEVIGDSTIPNITSPSVLPYSPFTGTTPLAYQLHLSENNTLKIGNNLHQVITIIIRSNYFTSNYNKNAK